MHDERHVMYRQLTAALVASGLIAGGATSGPASASGSAGEPFEVRGSFQTSDGVPDKHLRWGTHAADGAAEPNRDVEVEQIETASEGGYIVQVEEGASATEVLADRTAAAADDAQDLSGGAFTGVVADIDPAQAKQLRDDPRVVSVERDKVFTVNAVQGREPLNGSQWATQSTEESSATAVATAWGLDRTDQRDLPLDSGYFPPADGSDTHIYVVDSGVDLYHPDFGGRIGDSAYAVGGTALDCYGHGTHVAGTAASNTYGMAKGAIVHSVRVLDCTGSGQQSWTIAGLNWISENAEPRSVVNLSLGGGYSASVNSAVAGLVASGIPVVVAAGNDAINACDLSPASAGAAITVGAVDSTDSDASFSNFGPCLDVYAPGVDVRSLLMNEPGWSSAKSGTSMAAPHVAGAVAVLWSENPSLSGNQIDDYVLNEATTGVVKFPWGQAGSPNLNLHVGPAPPAPAPPAAAPPAAAPPAAAPPAAAPPAAAPPARVVAVKVKPTSGKSKLRVDVNPNKGRGFWKFQVQKQRADGSWKALKTYKTKGKKEIRTINLKRGTYRVVVKPKYGYQSSTSREVRLRR